MYQVRRPSRSEFVPIRHLKYHVRQWGQLVPGVAPLVMVHGWMDVGASYQFVVDALATDRWVIAPDWRGYGLTGFDAHAPGGPGYVPATDHYTFSDYLADLDALLDHYAPDQPVDLVGHSMGGNIVMLYAGVRPERIRRLVNLEGFGMPATRPSQAAGRYAKWLDEIKAIHTGAMALKTYDSVAGVASRLMKTNPRLGQDKADWLAPHWAAQSADGRWAILGDAAHKVINPQLYRVEEVLDIYGRITAPVLAVEASDNELDRWWKGKFTLAEYHERLQKVPQVRQAHVTDAGHMLHHDQPSQLAVLIEDFTA